MPKIKFTATPKLPADYKHLGYVKDMEIEGTKDWLDKWVNRNVAVYVVDAPKAKVAEVAVKEPEVVVAVESVVEPVAVEPVAEAKVEEPKTEPRVDAPRRGRPASR